MTTYADLQAKIDDIATVTWTITDGRVVPELEAIPLGNVGKELDACILYADLSDSTGLVGKVVNWQAAEYYKAFLYCACKLIENNDGVIEAFDGDRVMGVFLGLGKEDRAVKAALQLQLVMKELINPKFADIYKHLHVPIQHTVGIDTGRVMVCKAGVRGGSDLIWIGAPANYAAKLNSFKGLDHTYPTRVSEAVYRALSHNLKFFREGGGAAWQGPYSDLSPLIHYRTLGNHDMA